MHSDPWKLKMALTASKRATALSTLRQRCVDWGRYAVLLCLFSVPINKPATNIFIFFALLCSLCGARLRERFLSAVKQPIVIGAAIWFAVLTLSALHAPDATLRWSALGVYKALLYPLIVATLLETTSWRNRGLFSFALGTGLVLLISWAQFLHLVPLRDIAQIDKALSYTVFKEYTQQGITFLILAAMALSFIAIEPNSMRRRCLLGVATLAIVNVLFLLQSRTSYLIVAPLLLYWIGRAVIARLGTWRGIATGMLIVGLIGIAAFLTPRFQQRIAQGQQDVVTYSHGHTANSLGVRLELWKQTLSIIGTAPLFGHGLGQWQHEYALQTKDLPNFSGFLMGHPHQEALHILAEEGIAGFAIFVLLLVLLAQYSRRLAPPHREFFACLLLIYVTAGLANCLLTDFSHRHVFLMLLACLPRRADVRS